MKENKFIAFLKNHKVFTITIFLFVILVPLIFIPSVYISQIVSSRHVIFEDKSIKAIKVSDQEYFDIEVTLYSITEPVGSTSGKYIFDYKLTPKAAKNTITDVVFSGQLSVVNDKYTKFSSDLYTLESDSSTRLVFDWDYDMDKSILPFLKPKGPKLYLYISFLYDMAPPLNGNPEEVNLYIEVPFN